MTELNVFCFVTNLVVTVLCGTIFAITPTLTRKAYLFGVKIPESAQQDSEVKALRQRYFTSILLCTILVLALDIIQFLCRPELTVLAIIYFPLLIVLFQTIIFIFSWKKAGVLKKANNWEVSSLVFAESRSSHSRGNLSSIPWAYYIVSLILIVTSVIISLIHYPALPDQIPTHFDINMNPDSWSPKSPLTVLTMPFFNLLIMAIMLGTAIILVKAKLQLSPQNPALSFAQHRLYRRYMGHGIGFLALGLAVAFTLFSFITIFPDFKPPFWFVLTMILVSCLPMIIMPIYAGQGGCKLKPNISEADALAAGYQSNETKETFPGRGDDKHWALGMFYHNPDDPALMVEDRFGGNIGFNYSHTGVKIVVAVFALALIALYVWLTPLLLSIETLSKLG